MFSRQNAFDDTRYRCQSLWRFLWEVPLTYMKFIEAMEEVEKSILEEANSLFLIGTNYADCVKYNLLKSVTNSKMDVAAHLLLEYPNLTEDQTNTIIYASILAKEGLAINEANINRGILDEIDNARCRFLSEALETNDPGIVEINKILEKDVEYSRLKYETELDIIISKCQQISDKIANFFED